MTLEKKFDFNRYVVGVIILSSYCNIYAEGIFCYQCNSLEEPECATLKANDTHSFLYRPCEVQEYTTKEVFCRKIVQVIADRNNLVRVIRRCSWERHTRLPCYYVSNADHTEVVCQCFTDGCNSAPPGHKRSLFIVILALLFAAKFI